MAATARKQETTTAAPAATSAPKPAENTALAKAPAQAVVVARPQYSGTYSQAEEVTTKLREAAKHFIVLSPATACTQLPEGVGAVMSTVQIDPDRDTYMITGNRERPADTDKLGISKGAIMRLAAAANVMIVPSLSRRLDDGRHPHFCEYISYAHRYSFDRQSIVRPGHKQLDLRNGSQHTKSKTAKQIAQERQFIVEHAQTKSELRAIRAVLGIETGYTRADLKKPFLVVTTTLTGQSSDPEMRRMLHEKIADSYLNSSGLMFGPPAAGVVPALAPPVSNAGMLPPPASGGLEYDDLEDTPSGAAPALPRDTSPVKFRFGKAKDQPITEGTDRDLEWYGDALQKNVDDEEKARFRPQNEHDLAAIRAEQQRRKSAPKADAKPVDVVNGEVDESRLPRDEEQPPLPLNGY